jgi:hypothetical protein
MCNSYDSVCCCLIGCKGFWVTACRVTIGRWRTACFQEARNCNSRNFDAKDWRQGWVWTSTVAAGLCSPDSEFAVCRSNSWPTQITGKQYLFCYGGWSSAWKTPSGMFFYVLPPEIEAHYLLY